MLVAPLPQPLRCESHAVAFAPVETSERARPGGAPSGPHLDDYDHVCLTRNYVQLQVLEPEVDGYDVEAALDEVTRHRSFGGATRFSAAWSLT